MKSARGISRKFINFFSLLNSDQQSPLNIRRTPEGSNLRKPIKTEVVGILDTTFSGRLIACTVETTFTERFSLISSEILEIVSASLAAFNFIHSRLAVETLP
jgi:hypothetical protein